MRCECAFWEIQMTEDRGAAEYWRASTGVRSRCSGRHDAAVASTRGQEAEAPNVDPAAWGRGEKSTSSPKSKKRSTTTFGSRSGPSSTPAQWPWPIAGAVDFLI